MKLNIKTISKTLLIAFLAFTLLNCGDNGSGGTIRIVINGQTYELALKNARCNAGQPNGTGIYNLPIQCSAQFSNTGGIADSFSVLISDARAINDALGMYIPVSPSLLIMSFTLDGTQLAITSGGAEFSEISNITGGTTSFKFQADTAQAHIEGNFSGTTGIGY